MLIIEPDRLAQFGTFSRETLHPYFSHAGISERGVRKLLESITTIFAEGHDVDCCVEVGPWDESWFIVVRTQGGTTGERELETHQLMLCFRGRDEVCLGAGELMVCVLKPGDLLWIPAGVPHEHVFARETALAVFEILPATVHNMPLLHRIPNRECVHHAKGYVRLLAIG